MFTVRIQECYWSKSTLHLQYKIMPPDYLEMDIQDSFAAQVRCGYCLFLPFLLFLTRNTRFIPNLMAKSETKKKPRAYVKWRSPPATRPCGPSARLAEAARRRSRIRRRRAAARLPAAGRRPRGGSSMRRRRPLSKEVEVRRREASGGRRF